MALAGRILNRVSPRVLFSTDSDVRFVLAINDAWSPGAPVVKIRGVLEGPYCEFARTLTTRFELTGEISDSSRCRAYANMTDPCFWTPSLPFLYRLDAEFSEEGQPSGQIDRMIGLHHWATRGASLSMESKRFVLRGAEALDVSPDQLPAAREASATLLVHDPADAFCVEASRLGVGLIADMRGVSCAIDRLYQLAWHPSVLVALIDDDVWYANVPGLLTARTFKAHSDRPIRDHRAWVRLCALELRGNERPPAWAIGANFPLIAIRRGMSYADLHEARAACDQLQADLAPEFNLAGYFVAP